MWTSLTIVLAHSTVPTAASQFRYSWLTAPRYVQSTRVMCVLCGLLWVLVCVGCVYVFVLASFYALMFICLHVCLCILIVFFCVWCVLCVFSQVAYVFVVVVVGHTAVLPADHWKWFFAFVRLQRRAKVDQCGKHGIRIKKLILISNIAINTVYFFLTHCVLQGALASFWLLFVAFFIICLRWVRHTKR